MLTLFVRAKRQLFSLPRPYLVTRRKGGRKEKKNKTTEKREVRVTVIAKNKPGLIDATSAITIKALIQEPTE